MSKLQSVVVQFALALCRTHAVATRFLNSHLHMLEGYYIASEAGRSDEAADLLTHAYFHKDAHRRYMEQLENLEGMVRASNLSEEVREAVGWFNTKVTDPTSGDPVYQLK